jgi:hypothetical protein
MHSYRIFGRQTRRKQIMRKRITLKMDIKEMKWRGMDWIYLTQDRGQ